MKQIIYLGGKKAREYDGVDEPKQYGLYEKFVIRENAYHAHISTLPVFDVIGDCDWKEGEVKTEGVDYRVQLQAKNDYGEWYNTDTSDSLVKCLNTETRTVIVPIPKKQEGEEELWSEVASFFRGMRMFPELWQYLSEERFKELYPKVQAKDPLINPQILKK